MTTRRKALGLMSATAVAGALQWSGGDAWAQTPGALAVSIRVRSSPSMVAPAGVFLEAVVTDPAAGRSVYGAFDAQYLPAFHEFHYAWTLPDAGPVRAPDHLVAAHRRTDRAEGAFVSRVFATPGIHRVAVEVVAPDGRRGRAEATVAVADPEVVYGPASTIVVSAKGDFTGAPAHDPRNAVTSLKGAMARYDSLGTPQVRILLRRGETHKAPRRALTFEDQRPHCQIGAWGTGPRAQVDLRQAGGTFIVLEQAWADRALVLSGLHFLGGWDPTTELWKGPIHKGILRTHAEGALLLHDCSEEGCDLTVNARRIKKPRPGGSMIQIDEYTKTDFKNFLLLCPRTQTDVAITGCKVVQHPQALNGAQARGKTSEATYGRNAHNFFRGSARRLYIASNDVFVRHGWSRGVLYDNHALRLNRNDARGMRAIIARNHIEGMLARQSRKNTVPMNMVIEQNYIVANPMTRPALSFRGGAASIRNNIVVEHDTPKQPGSGAGFKGFIAVDWSGDIVATGQMPFLVHYNSFILLRRVAPAEILYQEGAPVAHVRLGNNLLWAPNQPTDPTRDGPLDVTPLPWDARYRGARLGWAELEDKVLPQTLFPGDSFTVPYWTDMFGEQLSQADFAGEAGRHVIGIQIDGKLAKFDAQRQEAAFDFRPEGVRITNLAPARWPEGASFRVHCDRGTTPSAMQTLYGHPPGTLSLYQPQPGSGAWRSAQPAGWIPRDFLGHPRPDTPSRGAVEPG
jgi:hypothetical protein